MMHVYSFYNNRYAKMENSLEDAFPVKVGNDASCQLAFYSFTGAPVEFLYEDDNVYAYRDGRPLGTLEEGVVWEGPNSLRCVYKQGTAQEQTYYIGGRKEITIGPQPDADITKDGSGLSLLKIGPSWYVEDREETYVNGQRIQGKTKIQPGDQVFFPYMTVILLDEDLLEVSSLDPFQSSLTPSKPPVSEMKKQYPDFRRTPRMMYDLPDERVTFSFPAQEGDDHGRSLWLIILPPLVMLIVMGIVALLIPRGIFIIISVMMFATTLITSTMQYFRERKRKKQRDEKRYRVYTNYLRQKQEELQQLREKQREVLYFHFPSFEKMKYFTSFLSERIWERTPTSPDFLKVRIGRATIPSSYEVAAGAGDFANREMDELVERSQEMIQAYSYVQDAPLTIRLAGAPLGLVGKNKIVRNEIHQLIGQLAFSHSYHDLRFVTIFDEKEYEDWEWVKWLPHMKMPNSHAKGMIYNEQTRDQLLPSLYSMLRDRDLEEGNEEKRFVPHVVFIVTNQELIAEHVIMEYLEENRSDLGISVIFATETKEKLSHQIGTLVQYIHDQEGEILIEDGKAVHQHFELDPVETDDHETFARTLYSLNHQTGVSNSIPEMVSFLDLFGTDAAGLPIRKNWLTNESSRTLAAPIGLKGKNDVVKLNLHEKAHGPHGLVAGTTGSGKSELLQTYILSLAVHYHPHEVAFLLIDYKGGGMAQPFENIPHLLGTITNIHESANFSTRALASIKSELKRRQTLFDRHKVNHIHAYTNLYKKGNVEEPMPHLFIISDEFAELKNEEPEFIRELVSTARIGRSLGVHLILATQKPGGVIDDQIWSNSRFRIALQVQDANDSKEILKNSDAADLKTTGRGYLQVGNNEVYELFQSAWSGAPYLTDTFEEEDDVSIVTDLGLVRVSDVEIERDKKDQQQTEIEATVAEIASVQEDLGLKRLASPWLPPLSDRLYKPELPATMPAEMPIGLKDEPEKQSQESYVYRFGLDGNIGVFGSSGFGKSTSMMTLMLEFVRSYSPEELHQYLFDFGNSTLLPLKRLPHTADYFRYDDQRKIEKFMGFMKDEMERRKQLFLDAEVSTISLFNQVSKEPLPYLVVAIDNFDLVKEELQDLENQFIQFARDGQTLGIVLMISATRTNAIRQPLMNNLKTKIIHHLIDASERFSIIGRSPYEVEPIPGRAIIKKDDAYLAQMYLPASGENDLEVLENVKGIVQEIGSEYASAQKPSPIPMLPSSLAYPEFIEHYLTVPVATGHVAVGLDEETVSPVQVDLSTHCLVTGQSRNGKTNVLRIMIDQILDQSPAMVAIFDGSDRGLVSYQSHASVNYLENKDQMLAWLEDVEEELSAREEGFLDQLNAGTKASFPGIYLVIDSTTRLNQIIDSLIQGRLANLIKQYGHLGFRVIAAGNANEFTKGFDPLSNELKQISQGVLLMKKSDQSLFTLPFTRKEEPILPGFGYYVLNGKEKKMQIPVWDGVEIHG
ncbi:type VII secretion protein EssC [Halobacillus fulvus]|nr:type VII secretion protein EssC [Halobacillus fulvus]